MPDPYSTLDVPRSATQDEIKKAFRAKAQKYHPDVVGASASATERAAAEAKFKEANAAYDVGETPAQGACAWPVVCVVWRGRINYGYRCPGLPGGA